MRKRRRYADNESLALELIGLPKSLVNFDWQALQQRLSDKQRQVWANTVEKHHRWNFSCGATRSGKTYLDYYKIPRRIQAARRPRHRPPL